jgi:hypothetical protein
MPLRVGFVRRFGAAMSSARSGLGDPRIEPSAIAALKCESRAIMYAFCWIVRLCPHQPETVCVGNRSTVSIAKDARKF